VDAPHVVRHSFASIANDLGSTEVTIAVLVGHAKDSVTSYIQGLLDGIEFKQTAYALDRDSRKAALARFLNRASSGDQQLIEQECQLAA
jgi:hypothetical protein